MRQQVLAATVGSAAFAAIAGCLLALLLVVRSWHRSGARSLAVFLAATATSWSGVLRLVDVSVGEAGLAAAISTDEADVRGGLLDVWVLISALYLAAASFLHFSARFPEQLSDGALPPTRYSFVSRVRVALLRRQGVIWTLGVFGPGPLLLLVAVYVLTTQAVLGVDAVEGLAALPIVFLFVAFPTLAMLMGVHFLHVGYRQASDVGRRELLWLLWGVYFSTWMILVPVFLMPFAFVPPVRSPWWADAMLVSWSLAPSVLVASVALATFYSGSVDPKLVLRRSTVLVIAGTAWIATYAALESVAADWLSETVGVPEIVVSVALALVAAAVALPLRSLGRRVSDRVVRVGAPGVTESIRL